MPCRGAFGEGRRIEHHDVVVAQGVSFEEFQGVFLDGAMLVRVKAIQLDVVLADVQRTTGAVQAVDLRRTSLHGIDAEASRVAEDVQHLLAGRVRSEQVPVDALIEKEPGFLSTFPVDEETVPKLGGHRLFRRRSPNPAVRGGFPAVFGQRFRTLVVDARQSITQGQLEGLDEGGEGLVHARRVALDDQHSAVQIGDEARHAVSFGVNDTAGVLVLVANEIECLPYFHRLGDFVLPPRIVWQLFVERQHAHGDAGVGGVMSPSEDGSFVCANLHPIPRLWIAFDSFDAATEHPRMLASDALVSLGFQRDGGHGGSGGFVHGANLLAGGLTCANAHGAGSLRRRLPCTKLATCGPPPRVGQVLGCESGPRHDALLDAIQPPVRAACRWGCLCSDRNARKVRTGGRCRSMQSAAPTWLTGMHWRRGRLPWRPTLPIVPPVDFCQPPLVRWPCEAPAIETTCFRACANR